MAVESHQGSTRRTKTENVVNEAHEDGAEQGQSSNHEGGGHAATAASGDWLIGQSSIFKLAGDALLTFGSEYFSRMGAPLWNGILQAGGALDILGRALPTSVGFAIGWEGYKNSPSRFEKIMYVGLKAAQVGVRMFAPQFTGIVDIASAVWTFLGMRYRS